MSTERCEYQENFVPCTLIHLDQDAWDPLDAIEAELEKDSAEIMVKWYEMIWNWYEIDMKWYEMIWNVNKCETSKIEAYWG